MSFESLCKEFGEDVGRCSADLRQDCGNIPASLCVRWYRLEIDEEIRDLIAAFNRGETTESIIAAVKKNGTLVTAETEAVLREIECHATGKSFCKARALPTGTKVAIGVGGSLVAVLVVRKLFFS
jgi:hypothetical protein